MQTNILARLERGIGTYNCSSMSCDAYVAWNAELGQMHQHQHMTHPRRKLICLLLHARQFIHAMPCPVQEVRSAVLELVSNLVVVNSAFTHTCLQLLVYSFLPPPAPPLPDAGQGKWQPSQEDLSIQATVLNALNKVGDLCCAVTRCSCCFAAGVDERGRVVVAYNVFCSTQASGCGHVTEAVVLYVSSVIVCAVAGKNNVEGCAHL